jgi:hypothetical protein
VTAIHIEGERAELVAIEGEQLSAITFVQNYLQLHFDGPLLTLVKMPSVIKGEDRFDVTSAGYRDALCSLITKKVSCAYVVTHDRVQIDFSDRASIVLSLQPENYVAAHIALFHSGNGGEWAAW